MTFWQLASAAARIALVYITVGALTLVWSLVWLVWLLTQTDASAGSYYFCTGTILTGVALLVIGLVLGPIGRASKQADQQAVVVPPQAVPADPVAQQPGAMQPVPPVAQPGQPVVAAPVTGPPRITTPA